MPRRPISLTTTTTPPENLCQGQVRGGGRRAKRKRAASCPVCQLWPSEWKWRRARVLRQPLDRLQDLEQLRCAGLRNDCVAAKCGPLAGGRRLAERRTRRARADARKGPPPLVDDQARRWIGALAYVTKRAARFLHSRSRRLWCCSSWAGGGGGVWTRESESESSPPPAGPAPQQPRKGSLVTSLPSPRSFSKLCAGSHTR